MVPDLAGSTHGDQTAGGHEQHCEKAQVPNARAPRSARTEEDDVQSGGLGSGSSTSGKRERRFGASKLLEGLMEKLLEHVFGLGFLNIAIGSWIVHLLEMF
jgi:hypothetical protein